MELTTQELIILLIIIIALGSVLGFIFKSAIKLIVTICLIIGLFFVCFTWLPDQAEQWVNGNKTPNDTVNEVINDINDSGMINTVNNVISSGNEYVEQNKDGWIDAFNSLMTKLGNIFNSDKSSENNQENRI